ncbi:MAG TPA: hypothetical protein VLH81_07840 [Desulfobacterales bacterium]|nr:hypothetical protein [Desulfobacterales bacterium]
MKREDGGRHRRRIGDGGGAHPGMLMRLGQDRLRQTHEQGGAERQGRDRTVSGVHPAYAAVLNVNTIP